VPVIAQTNDFPALLQAEKRSLGAQIAYELLLAGFLDAIVHK
jgi:hypothetical protein